MAQTTESEFPVRVFTQSRRLLDTQATEIVLPGYDGEVGVLAGHTDFIGLLGTGVLKVVRNGDDYWYMVSSGIFEVDSGKLTILCEVAEEVSEMNIEVARSQFQAVESQMNSLEVTDAEYPRVKIGYERAKARLEAYRRTELLN